MADQLVEMLRIPTHSWWHRREELECYAKTLDPAARLARKKSRVWNIGSLKTFATTIGRIVYIPDDWSYDEAKRSLPHEVLGHVKQYRWAGFFIHPTIGIPLGLFLYAVVFFPIFFAWVRYRMELHADVQAWTFKLKHKLVTPVQVKARAVRHAERVSGKQYVYSMPKFWVRWGFVRKAQQVTSNAAA
jgi:hypothetical protein